MILVNINPAYRLIELQYALGHSGCRWLFAASRFKDADFAGMVAAVRTELPDLERAIIFDDDRRGTSCSPAPATTTR